MNMENKVSDVVINEKYKFQNKYWWNFDFVKNEQTTKTWRSPDFYYNKTIDPTVNITNFLTTTRLIKN
jgi:hypothetical protein